MQKSELCLICLGQRPNFLQPYSLLFFFLRMNNTSSLWNSLRLSLGRSCFSRLLCLVLLLLHLSNATELWRFKLFVFTALACPCKEQATFLIWHNMSKVDEKTEAHVVLTELVIALGLCYSAGELVTQIGCHRRYARWLSLETWMLSHLDSGSEGFIIDMNHLGDYNTFFRLLFRALSLRLSLFK